MAENYRTATVKLDGKIQEIKINYAAIPPEILRELAIVCTLGEIKHGKGEWGDKYPFSKIYGKALRHLVTLYNEPGRDADNLQHPAVSVIFRMIQWMIYESTHPELDDRPKK